MPVRLKVAEGPNVGTIYFLGEGESKVFGRSSSADIQIQDPLLSRHHVMIRGSHAGGLVLDLDSSNGTFLNGRLVKEAPLDTGDKIKIGNVVLEVELERRSASGVFAPVDKVETVRALMFCSRCHRGVVVGDRTPFPWESFLCEACRKGSSPFDPTIIPGYRLIGRVGEEASGPLYQGIDIGNGRRVLVRFFAPTKGAVVDARSIETFMREAGIASRLQHPHIKQTLEAGERDGLYYMIEEWVEGTDLEARLKQAAGPLPLEEALAIAGKIASALEYAFGHGIVHRNVRPSSVVMGETGAVKLGDFGLAKSIGASASPSGITKAGEWHGQANYLPPEQLISESMVDQRSDVYALGATLYHMLAGKPPYDAPTAMKVVRRIGEGDLTPIGDLAPSAPKPLRAIVERCMERDAARRFQTPRELYAAIEACRAKLGIPG